MHTATQPARTQPAPLSCNRRLTATLARSPEQNCSQSFVLKLGATLGVTLVIAAHSAPPAMAGDYVHQCRNAAGNLIMNDEELRALNPATGREGRRALKYTVLRRIDLKKSDGFCVSDAAPRGSRRFAHSATTYALQIRYRRRGTTNTEFMMCEIASSGLPAAYNCDREVKTLNWVASARKAPGTAFDANAAKSPHRWMHNGSGMRIVASGQDRKIVYASPRNSLRRRGVEEGTVLFEGKRRGNRYTGRAFVFTENCGPVAYKVDGLVEQGERRVVVRGRKPRLNAQCRTISRRDDQLVFERR